MKLISGKEIASEFLEEIKLKVKSIKGRKPGLAFILVGNHPASLTYVNAKKKACAHTGIQSIDVNLSETVSQADLIKEIETLNKRSDVDGILLQLPLPSHLNSSIILQHIDPRKDADGFHPVNLGKLLLNDPTGIIPCTPLGVKSLLQKANIATEGKEVVIVGRSNIVGKPLALLLAQKSKGANATVTLAHSYSSHLEQITKRADILIAAIGKPKFIQGHMVKKGACVIDVGINRLENKKLVGDVDFEEVSQIASHITPVPGGIGPMTIAMLLQNTLNCYSR